MTFRANGIKRMQFLAGAVVAGMSATASRANAQSALTRLRIGTVASDSFAGVYFAQDMGFFQKAGLSVEIHTLRNGSAVSNAIAGGALDIGSATPITVANAVAHDVPLIIIAAGGLSTAKAPNTLLVVAQNSPVRVAKDLEGKAVAVTGIHGLADGGVDLWLEKNAVDPAKVPRIELIGGAMAAAIERGTVTAALMNEPARSIALKNGSFRIIGDPFLAIAPQVLTAAWYTTAAFAQQNPDVVRRFQGAIDAAQGWANAHHNESAPILAKYSNSDVDIIRGMARCVFADQLRASDIQPELDMAFKFGIIPKALKATDILARTALK
jgi:NitT/TauT family transport system substrate-binding protein